MDLLRSGMPRVPTLEALEADDATRDLYEDFQRRMGFPAPPNFIKTQGHNLDVARGTWGLVQHVLVGGALPRSLKEMIFTAISQDRGCQYCEAAHLACCRMLGVDEETMDRLLEDAASLSPERIRDILLFGLKCARSPQALEEADFASLRRHGMNHEEILEVIAMSALAVYANTIADATGMEPDRMFGEL